jgi:antitoxin VapB
MMQTARLFMNGRSQAVRLPKDCRFGGKEVYVHKLEGAVMLVSKDHPWASFIKSWGQFTDDFMEERHQPPVQRRRIRL